MHDPILAHLPAYAAGTLGATARATVDAHLAGCPACRLELAEWQALAAAARRQVAQRVLTVPAWVAPVGGDSPGVPLAAGGTGAARRWFPLLALLLALGLAGRQVLREAMPSGDADAGESRTAMSRSGEPADGAGRGPGGRARTLSPAGIPTKPTISANAALDPASEISALSALRRRPGAAIPPARQPLAPDAPPTAADRAMVPGPAGTAARPPTDGSTATGPTADPGAGPLAYGDPATTRDHPGDDPTEDPKEDPTENPTEDPRDEPATTLPVSSQTPIALPTDVWTPMPPATAPPSQGILTGRVHGPDGQPRAEIDVYAEPLDPAQGARKASTGSDGGYRLELPPGRWLLHAETAAYQLMWYGGSPNPLLAEPVEMAVGQSRRADFYLEPSPPGLIRGQVLDAAGRPLARALVVAAYPPDGEDAGPRLVWSVFSGADGGFSLSLPPGAWHLAAATDWRQPRLAWWGGAGAWEQSDALAVSALAPVDGVRLTVDP